MPVILLSAVHTHLNKHNSLSGQLLLRCYWCWKISLFLWHQECVLINNLMEMTGAPLLPTERERDDKRTNNKWRDGSPFGIEVIMYSYIVARRPAACRASGPQKKTQPARSRTLYLFVLNNWSPRSRQEPRRTKNAVECVTVARASQGD